jgi:hypothetical protein
MWNFLEGEQLFLAKKDQVLNDEQHLAEMVSLLGPPPLEFLERSAMSSQYWDSQGRFSLFSSDFELLDLLMLAKETGRDLFQFLISLSSPVSTCSRRRKGPRAYDSCAECCVGCLSRDLLRKSLLTMNFYSWKMKTCMTSSKYELICKTSLVHTPPPVVHLVPTILHISTC